MFSPSASITYSSAKSMMRTQPRPPTAPATNGNSASATAMSAIPIHFKRGFRFPLSSQSVTWLASPCLCYASARSGPFRHPLTHEARGPEHEHHDQYEERKHVLVIAAQEPAREIADVSRSEALDKAEQHAARHCATQVADPRPGRRRESP